MKIMKSCLVAKETLWWSHLVTMIDLTGSCINCFINRHIRILHASFLNLNIHLSWSARQLISEYCVDDFFKSTQWTTTHRPTPPFSINNPCLRHLLKSFPLLKSEHKVPTQPPSTIPLGTAFSSFSVTECHSILADPYRRRREGIFALPLSTPNLSVFEHTCWNLYLWESPCFNSEKFVCFPFYFIHF